MVEANFCVYPWDLAADGAADRIAASGATTVSIAAGYHAVRAATPFDPARRFVTAPRTALYTDTSAATWSGLAAADAFDWAGVDSFGRAREAARGAGLRVEAWIVLTHVDAAPTPVDSRVTTAFGDTFDYALCPSSPTTQAYVRDLVANVTAGADVDSIALEGLGPLGADHNFTHEKTSGADWSPLERQLLSACFCEHCSRAYREGGQDPESLAGRIRSLLDSPSALAEATSVAGLLGELAPGILRVRQAATQTARALVEAAARENGVTRVRYHASSDDWATGPFTALAGLGDAADVILPSGEVLTADVASLRARTTGLAAYTSAMPPVALDGIDALIERVASAGVDELLIYHAGLLGRERWARVAAAVRRASAPS